jgi:threonylcarbamoyladenosine tRNA methylthiotransferase MtaB
MTDAAHKSFAMSSLGCKVNQIDGQVIRERIAALGWREVGFKEEADLYIVNTCTVTGKADEKCRKQARRAKRRNPTATVIVTGCGAVADPKRFDEMDAVDAVFTREQMVHIEAFLTDRSMPKPGDAFSELVRDFSGHTRGFLKIQDGCESNCSYCIVPRVRGPLRSRPLADVAEQTRRLVEAGHIEIVLTGIHVGRYGADMADDLTLADAARTVLDVPGVRRMRVSSVEAMEVGDALLDLAESDDRFCPHFHLPLQSGDNDLLKAMGRPYTAELFLDRVKAIEARFDRPSITSDVMVGFPGETDAQFDNTLAACEAAGFNRIHIFPYSSRPGTPAATMPGQHDLWTKREREARLQGLAEEQAVAYKSQFIGETIYPLIESRRHNPTGRLIGWSPRYIRVALTDDDESLMGKIVPVKVTDVTAELVVGEVV